RARRVTGLLPVVRKGALHSPILTATHRFFDVAVARSDAGVATCSPPALFSKGGPRRRRLRAWHEDACPRARAAGAQRRPGASGGASGERDRQPELRTTRRAHAGGRRN